MEDTARLFNCALCHTQVAICRRCDRGNIYCGPICSSLARVESLRKANQRYQSSLSGKRKHAERQKRYQQKQKKMTDQGSQVFPDHGVLVCRSNEDRRRSHDPDSNHVYCHFCGETCSLFLRVGFLRHFAGEASSRKSSAWPFGP